MYINNNIDINLSYIVIFFIFIVFFIVVVSYIIYKLLKKDVTNDLERVIKSLEIFFSGGDIELKGAKTEEVNRLGELIGIMVKNIVGTKEQIEMMVSILGRKNFTIYQYFESCNRVFLTDNYKEVTHFEKEELELMIKNIYEETKTINDRIQEATISSGINGQILKVRRFNSSEFIFGIIENITVEENEKNELKEAKANSYVDELTGVYNRRKLFEYAKDIKKNIKERGVLLIFDLDNFKKINDEVGHLAGDRILKSFSEILRKFFRDGDLIIRAGGDEFVVIIPNDISKERLEEKLKKLIKEFNTEEDEYFKKYKFSVSIGAVFIDKNNFNLDVDYNRADVAMYQAKREGKNNFYIQS